MDKEGNSVDDKNTSKNKKGPRRSKKGTLEIMSKNERSVVAREVIWVERLGILLPI